MPTGQDATNTPPAIPLYHAPHGRGYKLLELPPELVTLLESDNPPTLTLHSTPTAAILKTPAGPNANAKTYSLRQKNTSNALMLLEPTDPADSNSTTGIRAIATVHETIELVPEEGEAPAPRARGKWHERFGKGR
ncbi:hypothetical protein QBC47DRAFT_380741 [Echria macrotheca]|uniref:Sister chromatid cohesion protein DCC1 n=1 Tax=Echria macrotheca TaxID=438768 RepID=A0AAJ0FBX2_9PEZI|nr:hypothetical protein QBC47DRAFT_380741 [Echria macrotheca]